MTGKKRMIKALSFQETDRPPHFEAMFELEQEAFGLKFPDRHLWDGCSAQQKKEMIDGCMEVYTRIVQTYQWDALTVYWPWSDPDGVRAAKKVFGESILIGGFVGMTVWSIENVTDWMQFSMDIADHPDKIHEEAKRKLKRALNLIDQMKDAGADYVYTPNDVAFNSGPFVSPADYHRFVAPYWTEEVQYAKSKGLYVFVHTDGNIMPIWDDFISMGAHCFQSIDPMAGMDIAEVKKKSYGKMALMGNVQCNLLQDGPDEAIRRSALYCLTHGTPGGGYVYSSSNTIFPGMPLKNYELMLRIRDEFVSGKNK